MPETLVIIQAGFSSEADEMHLRHYYERAWSALKGVSGYKGGGVWSDLEDRHKALVLYLYENAEAAEEGLKVVTHAPLLRESQRLAMEPPDVTRIRVVESAGALKDHPTDPAFLSLSIRVADPGLNRHLIEDLHTVFVESLLLPGFTGYLIGTNETLEEEVIGLAAWTSPAAYQSSLPAGILYSVRLYGRTL